MIITSCTEAEALPVRHIFLVLRFVAEMWIKIVFRFFVWLLLAGRHAYERRNLQGYRRTESREHENRHQNCVFVTNAFMHVGIAPGEQNQLEYPQYGSLKHEDGHQKCSNNYFHRNCYAQCRNTPRWGAVWSHKNSTLDLTILNFKKTSFPLERCRAQRYVQVDRTGIRGSWRFQSQRHRH